MPLVGFRKILPLFKDGIGDTIDSLNEMFSNFHQLGKVSKFEVVGKNLMLTSSLVTSRWVPIVLSEGKVYLSVWDSAEQILVFKGIVISDLIPMDIKSELQAQKVELKFLDYNYYYDLYIKEVQRYGSGIHQILHINVKYEDKSKK